MFKLNTNLTEFYQWFVGFSNVSYCKKSYTTKVLVNGRTTELEIFGKNFRSTTGNGRFTKQINHMIELSSYQYDIIISLILSNGWLG